MKSENFEILRGRWPELAELGGLAEAYAHADPASALVKLRVFAENVTKDIYRDLRLPRPDQPTFVDLLKNEAFSSVTPKVILDKLHALRIHGNHAAHGEEAKTSNTLWLLKEAHDLARWLLVQYGKAKAADLPAYKQPAAPLLEARERRHILEKLAVQDAQMDALLHELDVARQAARAAEKKVEELSSIAASAKTAADELAFDEATTRTRLIDSLLSSAGWDVAAGEASTSQRRSRFGISRPIPASGMPIMYFGTTTPIRSRLLKPKKHQSSPSLADTRPSSTLTGLKRFMVTGRSSSTPTGLTSGFGTMLRASRPADFTAFIRKTACNTSQTTNARSASRSIQSRSMS
jgi:type I restriction enzyme, R subunit